MRQVTMRAISLAEMERTLAYHSSDRGRAEAAFKKVQKGQEGGKARTEQEAEAQSVREKTSRLRALRLAKEAANLEPSVKKKPITPSDKPPPPDQDRSPRRWR
jgi:hypothetical protein